MKIDLRSRIEGYKINSFMKIESILVVGKDATQSGVGKVFNTLYFSNSTIKSFNYYWFFMNDMGRFLGKWSPY